jgi:hypothetical protein
MVQKMVGKSWQPGRSQLLLLNYGAAVVTEEDLQQLTALSEPAAEDSHAIVKWTASALKKQLQMVNNLIISVSSIISWKVASNLGTTCGLLWHQIRRCIRTGR